MIENRFHDASNAMPNLPPETSASTMRFHANSAAARYSLIVEFSADPVTAGKLLNGICRLLQNPNVFGASISGSTKAKEASADGGASTAK
jgi:hypothetical protein